MAQSGQSGGQDIRRALLICRMISFQTRCCPRTNPRAQDSQTATSLFATYTATSITYMFAVLFCPARQRFQAKLMGHSLTSIGRLALPGLLQRPCVFMVVGLARQGSRCSDKKFHFHASLGRRIVSLLAPSARAATRIRLRYRLPAG